MKCVRNEYGSLQIKSASRLVSMFWNEAGTCSICVRATEAFPGDFGGEDIEELVALDPQELLTVAAELVRMAKERHAEQLASYKATKTEAE